MLKFNILIVALSIILSLECAADSSKVQFLASKADFQKINSKTNGMTMVAFLASWLTVEVKEYTKGAHMLRPFVSAYIINCNSEHSESCPEESRGYPVIEFFRNGGKTESPEEHNGAMDGTRIFNWVMDKHNIEQVSGVEQIKAWVGHNTDKPRALILTKRKEISLKWKAIGAKYNGEIQLAIAPYTKNTLDQLGIKDAKILLYGSGSFQPTVYKGGPKFKSICKFFDHSLSSTAS